MRQRLPPVQDRAGALGWPDEDVTYMVGAPAVRLVKIGHTGSLYERLKSLASGLVGRELVVLAAAPGKGLERIAHALLARSRYQGEWFKPTPEVFDLALAWRARFYRDGLVHPRPKRGALGPLIGQARHLAWLEADS